MSGLGTSVNSSQAVISLRCYVNPQGATQQAVLNYTTADNFTADASAVIAVTVAAGVTNSSINLATLFAAYTAPVFVSIADISAPGIGFKITTVSGNGKVGVGANGFWVYTADGTTALPTVYIDNPSSTASLVLSVGLLTQ